MYPENGSFLIKPIIGGKMLTMEIDTGSALSIVSLNDYSCLFSGYGLRRTNIVINTDTGEKIVPIGSIQLDVTFNIITRKLKLFVIRNDAIPLFGRQWIKVFQYCQ